MVVLVFDPSRGRKILMFESLFYFESSTTAMLQREILSFFFFFLSIYNSPALTFPKFWIIGMCHTIQFRPDF